MWICDSLHHEYFWKLDLPSMSKRIYPTFSETFLRDSAKRKVLSMDHSRLTPTPFFGKRVITKSLLWTKKKIFIFSCTHFQEFTQRLVLMARSCETWNRPIFIRATHRKFTQVQVIFFFCFLCWPDSTESDVLAAFHAEQITYLEKKKTSQKRKGQGRDEQVIKCFIYVKVFITHGQARI